MKALCARRGLACRLHVKNEASAVQSDDEVVEVGQLAPTGGCFRRHIQGCVPPRTLPKGPADLLGRSGLNRLSCVPLRSPLRSI